MTGDSGSRAYAELGLCRFLQEMSAAQSSIQRSQESALYFVFFALLIGKMSVRWGDFVRVRAIWIWKVAGFRIPLRG